MCTAEWVGMLEETVFRRDMDFAGTGTRRPVGRSFFFTSRHHNIIIRFLSGTTPRIITRFPQMRVCVCVCFVFRGRAC